MDALVRAYRAETNLEARDKLARAIARVNASIIEYTAESADEHEPESYIGSWFAGKSTTAGRIQTYLADASQAISKTKRHGHGTIH